MILAEILSRYGKTFDWSLKSKMMGQKQRDAAEILINELNIPLSVDEYLEERNAKHAERFPSCRPLPGVMKLVQHLKRHNVPMAIATSSYHKGFLLKISQNQDLFSLFEGKVIYGDHPAVKNGKPAPDIFLEAAKLIGADDVNECLVFEDAPSGVQAGLNAGMHVVWVPDVNLELQEDLKSKVRRVLTSLEDFAPEEFGLPPY